MEVGKARGDQQRQTGGGGGVKGQIKTDINFIQNKTQSQLFCRDTLAHGGAPACQVWLQKVEQFRRYLVANKLTGTVPNFVMGVKKKQGPHKRLVSN